MTPQEQALIEQLFERLASAESAPRDAEAVREINQGLDRAPHALYALVQTVLIQEEALRRADERIRMLESGRGEADAPRGGFLDSMRDRFADRDNPRGSVPPVRGGSPWSTPPGGSGGTFGNQGGQPYATQQPAAAQPAPGGAFGGGGGFLGTAAAAAAGMVGGSLLMNSMRGMFGGGGEHGRGQGAFDSDNGGSSWGRDSGGGGELGRQAGLDDIGRHGGGGEQQAGLFGGSSQDESYADDGDSGFGGGDSDSA